jgi:rhodanese-related sulfurtransferase
MTINKLLYFLLIISLLIFGACSSSEEPEETVNEFKVVTESVGDDYIQNYTNASGSVNISMSDLYAIMTDNAQKENIFIIDLRSAADYATRHLTGATNIALGSLVDKVNDGTIPTNKTIICVCYTGQNASVATSVLNLLGFDARNLLFGMCGVTTDTDLVPKSDYWQNKVDASNWYMLDKTNDPAPGTTYEFPKLNTGKKESADIIKARFSKVVDWDGDGNADWNLSLASGTLPDALNNYFVINYWPAAEYLDPGHIEGAYQFTPKLDLMTTERLNELPTNQKIAVYCYTGQTSAQMTAYLRTIGYEAYSVAYGVNGFSYDQMTKSKYTAPTGDFSAVLEPAP